MSFALQHRSILVTGAALALLAALAGCGGKGPLYIPQTPAAAQRGTLPQTVWGGGTTAPSVAASAPILPPPPVLPDVPDIQQ